MVCRDDQNGRRLPANFLFRDDLGPHLRGGRAGGDEEQVREGLVGYDFCPRSFIRTLASLVAPYCFSHSPFPSSFETITTHRLIQTRHLSHPCPELRCFFGLCLSLRFGSSLGLSPHTNT
jgi:hypothetical protein